MRRPVPRSRGWSAPCQRRGQRSACGVVPEPDDVSGRVAEGGDGEQPLGKRTGDDFASVGEDSCDRVLDLVDVDVGQEPRLGGGEVIADPRAAEVAAGGIEARPAAVWVVDLPAKDVTVEGCRLTDVGGGMCR